MIVWNVRNFIGGRALGDDLLREIEREQGNDDVVQQNQYLGAGERRSRKGASDRENDDEDERKQDADVEQRDGRLVEIARVLLHLVLDRFQDLLERLVQQGEPFRLAVFENRSAHHHQPLLEFFGELSPTPGHFIQSLADGVVVACLDAPDQPLEVLGNLPLPVLRGKLHGLLQVGRQFHAHDHVTHQLGDERQRFDLLDARFPQRSLLNIVGDQHRKQDRGEKNVDRVFSQELVEQIRGEKEQRSRGQQACQQRCDENAGNRGVEFRGAQVPLQEIDCFLELRLVLRRLQFFSAGAGFAEFDERVQNALFKPLLASHNRLARHLDSAVQLPGRSFPGASAGHMLQNNGNPELNSLPSPYSR